MTKRISETIPIDSSEISKVDQAVKTVCDVPRSALRALFQNGCVKINDQICTNPGTRLRVGDIVQLEYDPNRKYKEVPKLFENRVFRVVFEDDALIVVDKQPGFLSNPGESSETNTLLNHINRYLGHRDEAIAVHRLDRDTSGLLVFAKQLPVWRQLKAQFHDQKPERVYDAIVRGHVEQSEGTFRSYLAVDKNLNQHSVDDEESGKLSITHYRVEKQLDDATWVKVRLETGRRNQIRVHFAEANHPVLGDVRYRAQQAVHPRWHSKHLALHASTLGFKHPSTDTELRFESPLPARMLGFLGQRSQRSPSAAKSKGPGKSKRSQRSTPGCSPGQQPNSIRGSKSKHRAEQQAPRRRR